MENDEAKERAGLGYSPRLVLVPAVVPIEEGDGCCVNGSNGQGNLSIKSSVVNIGGNGEGIRQSRLAGVGRRDGCGPNVWGEFEDSPRRQIARVKSGTGARHGGERVCNVAEG